MIANRVRNFNPSATPADAAPDYNPAGSGLGYDTNSGELCVNPDGTLKRMCDTAGTQTLTNKTLTAPVVNTPTGTGTHTALTASSNAITAAMSGTTFLLNAATSITATLPATAAGLWYKFVVQTPAGSGALHSIDCNAADKFVGTNAAGTALDGADGVTLVNTQATAKSSDTVTLIAITDGWLVTNMQGVWVKGT